MATKLKVTSNTKTKDSTAAPAKKSVALTSKSAPVKTAVPMKKAEPVKTAVKPAPAKKAEAVKVAPKIVPAKKAVPAKPVAKAAPVKATAVKKVEAPKAPAKPVAKAAPVKAEPVKKVEAPKAPAKPVAKATPVKAEPVDPMVEVTHFEVEPVKIIETPKEPVKAPVRKSSSRRTAAKELIIKPPPVQRIETPKAVTKKPDSQQDQSDKIPEYRRTDARYSDEDLSDFRRRISDVRREALEELSMLKERLEDLTNYDFAEESMIYSMHMAEQGSEAMEKEKTYAQIQRINEYIKKLDEALHRISEKTYGICRVCGCLIAKERLWAVPITTLSASYKIHKRCPEDGLDRIEPLK